MKTVEELLKPRIKITSLWPNCDIGLKVGDIITLPSDIWKYADENETKCDLDFFMDYPYNFKKLDWWEERQIEDLPKYVKSLIDQQFYKVTEFNSVSFRGYRTGQMSIDYTWDNVLPATQDDYEQSHQK